MSKVSFERVNTVQNLILYQSLANLHPGTDKRGRHHLDILEGRNALYPTIREVWYIHPSTRQRCTNWTRECHPTYLIPSHILCIGWRIRQCVCPFPSLGPVSDCEAPTATVTATFYASSSKYPPAEQANTIIPISTLSNTSSDHASVPPSFSVKCPRHFLLFNPDTYLPCIHSST
jgi:hypothetical protein